MNQTCVYFVVRSLSTRPGLNNVLYNLFSIGTRRKSVIPSIMGNRRAFFVPGLGVFIIKMGKEAKDKKRM